LVAGGGLDGRVALAEVGRDGLRSGEAQRADGWPGERNAKVGADADAAAVDGGDQPASEGTLLEFKGMERSRRVQFTESIHY
jgi:hypothetical protein